MFQAGDLGFLIGGLGLEASKFSPKHKPKIQNNLPEHLQLTDRIAKTKLNTPKNKGVLWVILFVQSYGPLRINTHMTDMSEIILTVQLCLSKYCSITNKFQREVIFSWKNFIHVNI